MLSGVNSKDICKISLFCLNSLVFAKNVIEFTQNSLDDLVEDSIKLSFYYTFYKLTASLPNFITLPIYLSSSYVIDRYAETTSDQYMEKFSNISQNYSYVVPEMIAEKIFKKDSSPEKDQKLKHPYGKSDFCNFIENNLEDIVKIAPILAIYHDEFTSTNKFFALANTYIYANEFGDIISDYVELNCNLILNSTGYISDDTVN